MDAYESYIMSPQCEVKTLASPVTTGCGTCCNFGYGVSESGGVLFVGASGANNNNGAVYVYNTSDWSLVR